MALITINGVAVPSPSHYKTGLADFTKMLRNARAVMIGEMIRPDAVKIEMSWNYINEDDLSQILTAIKPLFFPVTYLDQETQTYMTKTFYKGDRSIPLFDFLGEVPRYKDFAFNLIER